MALLNVATASCGHQSSEESRQAAPWIDRFLADQQSGNNTVVEAVDYRGQEAFHVLPGDRAADSGNDHILYDKHGDLICEFGGYVPRVTKGSCVIGKIVFRKQLFPK